MVEPWLRGTLRDTDALRRQVLHALEQAGEDIERWCGPLTDVEMEVRPFAMASAGFHLRHIARSLDRLLTYTEGRALSDKQMSALHAEQEPGTSAGATLQEVRSALEVASRRIPSFSPRDYEATREVGRDRLRTTLGGLLVHVAEHTQRHVGQAISAAQLAVRTGNVKQSAE